MEHYILLKNRQNFTRILVKIEILNKYTKFLLGILTKIDIFSFCLNFLFFSFCPLFHFFLLSFVFFFIIFTQFFVFFADFPQTFLRKVYFYFCNFIYFLLKLSFIKISIFLTFLCNFRGESSVKFSRQNTMK